MWDRCVRGLELLQNGVKIKMKNCKIFLSDKGGSRELLCDENVNSCLCHWILCHQQGPVLNFKNTFMPLSLSAIVLFCVWDQWDFTGILGCLQLRELI